MLPCTLGVAWQIDRPINPRFDEVDYIERFFFDFYNEILKSSRGSRSRTRPAHAHIHALAASSTTPPATVARLGRRGLRTERQEGSLFYLLNLLRRTEAPTHRHSDTPKLRRTDTPTHRSSDAPKRPKRFSVSRIFSLLHRGNRRRTLNKFFDPICIDVDVVVSSSSAVSFCCSVPSKKNVSSSFVSVQSQARRLHC